MGDGKVTERKARKKSGDDTKRREKQEEKNAERKGDIAAVKWRVRDTSDKG